MTVAFCVVLVLVTFACNVAGSGMMLEPINRASLWRKDKTQPANYHDDELFCGGVVIQYLMNDGKCGVCGDNVVDPQPRSNENTGTYGNGIIVNKYQSGNVIRTYIKLTNNVLGSIKYSLCVLNDSSKPETEECFQHLKLTDGSDEYNVSAGEYSIINHVQLPAGVTCERCVLRWQYISAIPWGICTSGGGGIGCDAKETFRSCSDIAIV